MQKMEEKNKSTFLEIANETQKCKISITTPPEEKYVVILPMGGHKQKEGLEDKEGAYEQSQPWFHKNANRANAVEILKGQECGTFLVRPSSIAGHYVISRVDETGEVWRKESKAPGDCLFLNKKKGTNLNIFKRTGKTPTYLSFVSWLFS